MGAWARRVRGREVPAEWGLPELEIREGQGGKRAGASGVAPDLRPVELARRGVPDSRSDSCEGDFALLLCVPGLTL